ncbi:hypothetical protein MASR2M48_20360 [Spirochaetota bacterium]
MNDAGTGVVLAVGRNLDALPCGVIFQAVEGAASVAIHDVSQYQ